MIDDQNYYDNRSGDERIIMMVMEAVLDYDQVIWKFLHDHGHMYK
jgi:hypothetical protein